MADDPEVVMQTNRTRSRLGCLCCRRRRRKCDGTQPRCRSCQARGDECRWGLKVSFHPSRALRLSREDSVALLAIERERDQSGGPSVTTIVDNTQQIARGYQNCYITSPLDPQSSRASTLDHHPEDPIAQYAELELTSSRLVVLDRNVTANSAPTAQSQGLADNDRFIQCAAPSLSWNDQSEQNDASSANTLASSSLLDRSVSHNAPSQIEAELPVSKTEQARLIRAYLQETGTWCETTDSGRHFTVSRIHKLMENKPFAAAAMALASRQLDAVRHSQRQSTLSLYQHAVQSLLHYAPSQCDDATLATCILLSVYEMMASDVDEWRRHLKGCVWNLRSKGWNGSSPGLVNACFWAFARIDVWAAFVLGEETLIPTGDWVDESDARSIAATGTVDAYCNLAILIFAKVTNLVATSEKQPQDSYNRPAKINALWRELQDWRIHCPSQVLSLLRTEVDHEIPFPTVLYASSSSICGNTFYHAGSILLLQMGCVHWNEMEAEAHKYNPVWHARELCGISIANASHANWVNHLQALYIAGQVFGCGSARQQSVSVRLDEDDIARKEEYASEKLALLRHLSRIERETGWTTSGRAAELRRVWRLE
ncbi:putative Zn(II)2Cys6 transcription factor [Paraphoma chrysanthemicola]|nr:putative Zn(II)2Cys6 transcription factor [Paraphoma chrysanthemicola]